MKLWILLEITDGLMSDQCKKDYVKYFKGIFNLIDFLLIFNLPCFLLMGVYYFGGFIDLIKVKIISYYLLIISQMEKCHYFCKLIFFKILLLVLLGSLVVILFFKLDYLIIRKSLIDLIVCLDSFVLIHEFLFLSRDLLVNFLQSWRRSWSLMSFFLIFQIFVFFHFLINKLVAAPAILLSYY